MPKRQALNQLVQENWDEQEEREVPGTFNKLPEESLSNRIIKQAKRRSANLGNTMQSSSPFASFKGFGNKIEARTSENGDINLSQHGNGSVLMKQSSLPKSQESSGQQKNDSCRDMEYYRLLKCLNESLVSWVTQHLTKNPLCDFTPVFSDYKRHMEDLEVKFPVHEDDNTHEGDKIKENSNTVPLSQPSKPFASLVPTEKGGTFGTVSKIMPDNTMNSSGINLFGNISSKESTVSTQNVLSASPLFSVSKPVPASNTVVSTTGFQFGSITNSSTTKPSVNTNLIADCGKVETNVSAAPVISNTSTMETKPFSFSSSIVQSNEKKEDTEESEENTEPPKNEFTPVVEKDAVYSKCCKLFYNKGGSYVEKGKGTLYLKPCNQKMQLLVRADTSLGNILLNILLTSSLPVKRVGTNNVMIICIPNPPIDISKSDEKEAVSILIRVKTEDDANELLKQIEESKTS